MERYVVDASIILGWVVSDVQKDDKGKGRALLNAWGEGRVELAAPELWQYEVGHFLGRELPAEAAEKIELLLNLNIRSVKLNERMFRQCFVWMKMRKNQFTFFEISYLAVAREIKATLVTADKRFEAEMGDIGRICLLKDIDIGYA